MTCETNQPFRFLAGSCCRETIRSTAGGKTNRNHVMVRIRILVVAALIYRIFGRVINIAVLQSPVG